MKKTTKDNVHEINLKIKYKIGTPVFGMSNSSRKYFGMSKKQLKKWSKLMSKKWK